MPIYSDNSFPDITLVFFNTTWLLERHLPCHMCHMPPCGARLRGRGWRRNNAEFNNSNSITASTHMSTEFISDGFRLKSGHMCSCRKRLKGLILPFEYFCAVLTSLSRLRLAVLKICADDRCFCRKHRIFTIFACTFVTLESSVELTYV